jgi:cell division septum initiation protein DivIVA
MTKHDEIQALMELAHKLGGNSYCGPWLESQIPFIEHDMRCDILPTSSWSETRRLHDGMLNTAREQANYIIKDANEKAGKIMSDAQKHSENTRRMLARDIQRALDAL